MELRDQLKRAAEILGKKIQEPHPENKDEIKVGDEVCIVHENGTITNIGRVTSLSDNGDVYTTNYPHPRPANRRTDTIERV